MMRDYAELVKDLRCHAGTCEYKETECSRYNKRFDDTDYTTCSEELCDDAADAIEELLVKVPHWISVEERLPEKWEPVYAAVRSEGREDWVIEVEVYDPYLTCPWGHIPMIENGKAEVYAWMPRPLPEPPKEAAL